MSRPVTDEEVQERGALDGRVAFAITAFAAIAGLIALLDRVGLSERFIATTGPVAALVGMALIGGLMRSMRISRFYAAGRATPPAYAGFATAAIAAGLAIPFTPPVADSYSGAGVFAGFVGGLLGVALFSGPYLRKTGAFSVSDLVGARFPNRALRLGVAIIVGVSALLAGLAGYDAAVSGLTTIAGVSRPAAAVLIGATLAMATMPGGLAGVVWATVAAAVLFVAAYALPIASLTYRGQPLAMPFFGDQEAWRTAVGSIELWQGDIGQPLSATLALGMALGMAACAPLLAPMVAVRDRVAATRAGIGALIWGGVLAALIVSTVAASALGLIDSMVGRRPDQLPDPIYAASATRLMTICGATAATPQRARDACQKAPGFEGRVRPDDIGAQGAFLLTALPPLGAFGAAMSGFVWAAVVALGVALAASGLLAAAIALGNDAIHRVRDQKALTSRRLAIVRAILLAAIAMGGSLCSSGALDPRAFIGVSFAFSAAGLTPLLALALWPRARSRDALFALLVGLALAEALLLTGTGSVKGLAFAALAGCFAAVAAGVASSFIGGGDRSEGRAFVSALLRSDGDVLKPDKGA